MPKQPRKGKEAEGVVFAQESGCCLPCHPRAWTASISRTLLYMLIDTSVMLHGACSKMSVSWSGRQQRTPLVPAGASEGRQHSGTSLGCGERAPVVSPEASTWSEPFSIHAVTPYRRGRCLLAFCWTGMLLKSPMLPCTSQGPSRASIIQAHIFLCPIVTRDGVPKVCPYVFLFELYRV